MEQAMKDKSEGVEQRRFRSKAVNCFLFYELFGSTILRCTQRSTDRRVRRVANSRLQHIKFGEHLNPGYHQVLWAGRMLRCVWRSTDKRVCCGYNSRQLVRRFDTLSSGYTKSGYTKFWVYQVLWANRLSTLKSSHVKIHHVKVLRRMPQKRGLTIRTEKAILDPRQADRSFAASAVFDWRVEGG